MVLTFIGVTHSPGLISGALKAHSTGYITLLPLFFSAAQFGGTDFVNICENLECNLKISLNVCWNNQFLDSTFPNNGSKTTLSVCLCHRPLGKLPFLLSHL